MITNTPSELVRQIVGTFIEDDRTPKAPLLEWLQSECRSGCFRQLLEECAKAQPEPLRVDLAIVEKANSDKITVRLPARVADHESASPFEVNVAFEINPLTMTVKRV
jgi:hypothetical protein